MQMDALYTWSIYLKSRMKRVNVKYNRDLWWIILILTSCKRKLNQLIDDFHLLRQERKTAV